MSLSVLMSVYHKDKPAFLDTAIASVCENQSQKPDEMVLVEDGPLGEDLLRVIAAWKKKLGESMTILQNQENEGLAKALNKGLSHINTDYIARMDADDVSCPERFEKQIAFLECHPEISIVGGSIREFNNSNSCLAERYYPLTNEEALRYICKASPLAHPAVMMRRDLFSIGGLRYNENTHSNEDIELWFKVLCAGYKIANIDDVVLNFRMEEDVYKRRSRKKAWREFLIYMGGIRHLYGLVTFKYVYPLARLIFRLMPSCIVGRTYHSKVRSLVVTPPEPLISIITPNYNCEKYISETIESVLVQSYGNWELLIQDDCSTDGSYALALEYARKDSRIKVERNPENSGAAITRNNAIARSKGEYLAFLDSDDLWVRDKLERQLRFMQENGCDFSFTRYEHISEEGSPTGKVARVVKNLSYRKYLFHCWTGCLTVMYRQDPNNKIYGPAVPNNDDYALFLRVLKSGCKRAMGQNEVLAKYRVRAGSLSRNKFKKLRSYISVLHEDNGVPRLFAWFFLFTNLTIKTLFKYERP